jgi:hypothetical protein
MLPASPPRLHSNESLPRTRTKSMDESAIDKTVIRFVAFAVAG